MYWYKFLKYNLNLNNKTEKIGLTAVIVYKDSNTERMATRICLSRPIG